MAFFSRYEREKEITLRLERQQMSVGAINDIAASEASLAGPAISKFETTRYLPLQRHLSQALLFQNLK